jgi:hypothetical protein
MDDINIKYKLMKINNYLHDIYLFKKKCNNINLDNILKNCNNDNLELCVKRLNEFIDCKKKN